MTSGVSQLSSPRRSHVVSIIVGFGILYSLTATWGYEANVDAIAAALPAWSLAERGTIELGPFAALNPWFVQGTEGWFSNRPPGIWILATPAYLVAQHDIFTNTPATLTAVAVTVGALAVVYLLLCKLVNARPALVATLILGAGTSTWSISADALWPHGPVQLWMALSMLALASGKYAAAGAAYAAAALARPVTFVIPGVQAIYEGLFRRDLLRATKLILTSSVGILALALFNWRIFGSFGVTGGYPSTIQARLASPDISSWLSELFRLLVDPRNGMLLWSPILLVLVPGLRAAWTIAPAWVRASALSGAAYLVVHALLNRASGGLAFGYRYQLAAITLAAPLYVLSWVEWGRHRRIRVILVAMGAGVSVAAQLALVFTLECVPRAGSEMFSCSLFQF